MPENSLVIFTKAAQMLAEAVTIQQAKELKDLALTAADWAKRKGMGEEAIQHCRSYALEAERKMGEMLKETERAKPGPDKKDRLHDVTEPPTLAELGLSKRESSEAQMLADISREIFDEIKDGSKTIADVKREIKRVEIIEHLESIAVKKAKAIEGIYDVIIIDPPWPMKRIEREVSPTKVEFDYPTMTLEEINELKIPTGDNCHIFLWTTQKFLPYALEILKGWHFTYVCTFVWHKTGGFQPWNLPQYNCEFCLYAHKGAPTFVDAKNFMVCFNAPRRKHSEKPEEFYSMIQRVTAGRRLDMFSREPRDGYDSWGKEAI